MELHRNKLNRILFDIQDILSGNYLSTSLVCMPVFLIAQDTISKNRIGILPVPSFGYSPETGTYFGAEHFLLFRKVPIRFHGQAMLKLSLFIH